MDLLQIVQELNQDLYDVHKEENLCFSFETNGFCEIITFNEAIIWNSEDEEREWIEKSNSYEPMIPFLKRKFSEYADLLQKLKL